MDCAMFMMGSEELFLRDIRKNNAVPYKRVLNHLRIEICILIKYSLRNLPNCEINIILLFSAVYSTAVVVNLRNFILLFISILNTWQ